MAAKAAMLNLLVARFVMKRVLMSSRAMGAVRFGSGVATAAGLTFTVLSAGAAQPQRGVRISAEGAQPKISCMDFCRDRVYQCLVAGTNRNICYYNYNQCSIGCNGGFTRTAPESEAELN